MINILFFIPGLSEGGAEKVLRSLVNNMDQTKFNITVHTIDECNPEKYLAEGITYKAINRCKSALGKKIFSYWFRLCAELKIAYRLFVKGKYDIEVAYLETGATKIIAQSTNNAAVKIAWVHCDLSKKERMATVADKVKEQYKQFDKIVCVSEDTRTGFHNLFGSDFDTVVLHNVIDEQEILEKANETIEWEQNVNETQLLAIGRLTQQKNFAYLIETCGRLLAEGYKFHLSILGEGPERNNLERQISELGLDDAVTLRGFTGNPYPWMKQADIIVCSSKYEGISTVVQEALILGKPIVTTPCTGMEELLGESEYGMIVDDSNEGLYLGLKEMMMDATVTDKYSSKAKHRSELFTKKVAVENTEVFFKVCVHSNE